MNQPPPLKKDRCRFDMFIRIRPGVVSWLPGQVRTFCYRGDFFTDIEAKMLRNLIKLLQKRIDQFDLVELYDNNFPRDQPGRILLKIGAGVIEINELARYQDLLINFPLPNFLK